MDRIENIEFCIRYLLEIEKTKLGIETGIPHDLRGKQRLLRALMNIWEPQPLSEEYLRAQDAELQAQIQDKGVVTLEDITASVPRSVLLWQGDITRLRVKRWAAGLRCTLASTTVFIVLLACNCARNVLRP